MDKIGAAIIGPGKVAHIHARALAALPEARFVAVCGRNPERTQAFADQYGVRAYTNLTQMVNEPEVQLVLICTPHPQHTEQAIIAAQAGVHALVEKPLAITLADCDRMIFVRPGCRLRIAVDVMPAFPLTALERLRSCTLRRLLIYHLQCKR